MNEEVVGITGTIQFFSQTFNAGRDVLSSNAWSLFQLLVILEVVFSGIYIAVGGSADFRATARKLLVVGFISYAISNYTEILNTVLDGFLFAGQKATGVQNVNMDLMKDPGSIFTLGCQKLKPAFTQLMQYSLWGALSLDPLIILICIIVSCFSFGLMAIQVFVTYIEFLLISSLGFILIPFGVFKPLSFLSDKVFGAIIAFGIKFMTLGLILGVTEAYVTKLSLPPTVTFQQTLDFSIVALALAFLTLHAPGVALSLLSGSPHLSAATVGATAVGTGMAMGRAMSTSGAVIGGATGAIAATAGAAKGGAQAAAQAMGTTPGGSSGAGKVLQAGKKVAAGAIGAVGGVVGGAISSASEKAMYGKEGSPNGSKATRNMLGVSTQTGGMVGAFNRGQFSAPGYRAMAKANFKKASGSKNDGPKNQSKAEK